MRTSQFKKGVSLLEILFSLSIIFVVVWSTLSYFPKSTGTEALKKDAEGVVSLLEQARSLSVSSKEAATYGVHFDSNRAVLFKDVYDVSNINNVYELNSVVEISNISIVPSGSEIVFSRLSGEATFYGSVRVSLRSDANSSTTITVLQTGMVQ